MAASRLTLELDGNRFELELMETQAPRAAAALRRLSPLTGEVIHAQWSGPLCLMVDIDLAGAPLENPATYLSLGDFIYQPEHKELGIAYAATQFREPIGAAYVTMLGRVVGDLSRIVAVGSRLQRTGARPLVIR